MTPVQIRELIQSGEWTSMAIELRPSVNKTPAGAPQPFYCSRIFKYSAPDRFECVATNYADPEGQTHLAKFIIKGSNVSKGNTPFARAPYTLVNFPDTPMK